MSRKTRKPAPCPQTGYPRYNSAQDAWKAGTKIIRHPENTTVFVGKCEHCKQYHFRVRDVEE